ncbi:MAG: efflux RND transporter permease subunit [Synergistota bacterium]|nr:efflux RND transporter permease subunit [Synergistota bacterium]
MEWIVRILRQRKVVYSLFLGAALLGVLAWVSMPREEDPPLSYRAGMIQAVFPGADAESVERLVVIPLERRLSQVKEVKRIKVTARRGSALFLIHLHDEVMDSTAAWDEVRRAMEKARPDLPSEVTGLVLDDRMMDYESIVVAIGGTADLLELRNGAIALEKELLRLPSVSRVLRISDPGEQITVPYDDSTAERMGLSPRNLRQALSMQNRTMPGGSLVMGEKSAALQAHTEFKSVGEIEDTPVRLPSGGTVPLKTIAKVIHGPSEPARDRMRYMGNPAVGLGIVPVTPVNSIEFGKGVRKILEKMREKLSLLEIEEVSFQPHYVDLRLKGLSNSLLMSMVLVGGILCFSVGFRMGMVVSSVIPLIVLSSLGFYALCGGVLNQISIAAFVIALGMLVDNAIVMAESVEVRMKNGSGGMDAAVDSVRELGSPLLAATGTTVAAFLPLWMAHGQAAEFLRAIPQVVTLTLFLSLLAAMIVTPTLAALAFRKSRGNTADYGGRFNLGRAIGAFSSKHAVLILLMSLSLLLVVGGYGKHVRKNFFPGADRNVVMVDLFLPEGADIHAIDGIVGKVERHLKNEVPSVSRVASFIGRGAPRFYANIVPAPRNPHRAQMILFTTSQSQNHSVVGEIRSYLGEEIPQVNSVVQELVLGTPVDAPVEIRLYGNSLKDLRFGAERVMEAMKRIPGMVDLRHTLGNGNPSLEFDVSSGAAFRYGLYRDQVAQVLSGRTLGLPAGEYRQEEEPVPIVLRSEKGVFFGADRISSVLMDSSTGVPLQTVAPTEIAWHPSAISRRNRERYVAVQSNLEDGYVYSDVMTRLLPILSETDLPEGVRFEIGGEAEASGEAQGSFSLAAPFGLIVLVGILLAGFRSFRKVGMVLATIPLASLGVIPGLLLSGEPFGLMSLLGVIALAGIVVNNAIVLLDVVELRRKKGLSVHEALTKAVEERIRPILLTSGTTAAGLFPLAFSSSNLWPPMAWAMISGLCASTALTLFVIPAMYRVLYPEKSVFARLLGLIRVLVGTKTVRNDQI